MTTYFDHDKLELSAGASFIECGDGTTGKIKPRPTDARIGEVRIK